MPITNPEDFRHRYVVTPAAGGRPVTPDDLATGGHGTKLGRSGPDYTWDPATDRPDLRCDGHDGCLACHLIINHPGIHRG